MSTPISPRVVKGALVGLDLFKPLSSVIVFQYNPESVSRTLQAQGSGEGGARSEAMRLKGPPIETIKLEVEIDDLSQVATAPDLGLGIHPQLAALEMLLYPSSALTIANTVALALGTIEVMPPVGPFTLLVWGAKRVLPVRLTEFSVTEEMHDRDLNPLHAKVSLGLRVLSSNDLSITHPGYYVFLSHQIVKETMATLAGASDLAGVVGADVKIF